MPVKLEAPPSYSEAIKKTDFSSETHKLYVHRDGDCNIVLYNSKNRKVPAFYIRCNSCDQESFHLSVNVACRDGHPLLDVSHDGAEGQSIKVSTSCLKGEVVQAKIQPQGRSRWEFVDQSGVQFVWKNIEFNDYQLERVLDNKVVAYFKGPSFLSYIVDAKSSLGRLEVFSPVNSIPLAVATLIGLSEVVKRGM